MFTSLEPVFLDRDSVCLCVLVQLLSMYAMGAAAGFVIPVVSPRVTTLPLRRRKQLEVAIPVIVVKATIMALLADTLLASHGLQPGLADSPPLPSMEYRFQTLFFLALSYVFELLQRPSSAELVLHHLYLQGLPLYYWSWLRFRSRAQADLVVRFFELMALLGPGATDIASDITFLLYYCAGRSRRGLAALRVTSWVAAAMRAAQWVVLGGYGYTRFADARVLLSPWEKGVFVVSVALWVWTEIDEILKIRGMVGRFRTSLDKKTSDAYRN